MRNSLKKVKMHPTRMAIREFVNKRDILPLVLRISWIRIRAFFRIGDHFVVDSLLRTSFTYRCIRRIFPTTQKRILWHSRQVAIITMKPAVYFISADDLVLNLNSNSEDDTLSNEFSLLHVASQIKLHANLQTAVLMGCQGDGPMTIETTKALHADVSSTCEVY